MNDIYKSILNPEMISKYQEENPNSKVTDIVFDVLERAILSSQIQPGSKLNATAIAKAMNISITPVRAAIRQLAAIGLISEGEHGKNHSTFDIDEKMLMDIFAARRILEGSAAYLCAQRIALIDMTELRRQAERFRVLWRQFGDGDRSAANRKARIEIDREFHILVVQYAQNPYLISFYETTNKILTHSLLRTLEFWDTDESANIYTLSEQHHIICNGIESGIPEVARQAAEAHIDFAKLRCAVNRKFF